MFYNVRILDPKGNLKTIISSKKLSNRFWKKYEQGETHPMDMEDYGLESEKGLGKPSSSSKMDERQTRG